MDLYQSYIHISRYSRWRDDLGRRETWEETVQRYIDFFDAKTEHRFGPVLQGKVKDAITALGVMPSMRALMTAGEALERENCPTRKSFTNPPQQGGFFRRSL